VCIALVRLVICAATLSELLCDACVVVRVPARIHYDLPWVQFKAGTFNVLVATCVGEEGLDIGEVDLIVCFDAAASAGRMVQRMGRTGRKRNGRIVMLLMRGREEMLYQRTQKRKVQVHSAMSKGSSSFSFYKDSPRMVPPHIHPEEKLVFIEIDQRLPRGVSPRKRLAAQSIGDADAAQGVTHAGASGKELGHDGDSSAIVSSIQRRLHWEQESKRSRKAISPEALLQGSQVNDHAGAFDALLAGDAHPWMMNSVEIRDYLDHYAQPDSWPLCDSSAVLSSYPLCKDRPLTWDRWSSRFEAHSSAATDWSFTVSHSDLTRCLCDLLTAGNEWQDAYIRGDTRCSDSLPMSEDAASEALTSPDHWRRAAQSTEKQQQQQIMDDAGARRVSSGLPSLKELIAQATCGVCVCVCVCVSVCVSVSVSVSLSFSVSVSVSVAFACPFGVCLSL
jgi:hypothetical protein